MLALGTRGAAGNCSTHPIGAASARWQMATAIAGFRGLPQSATTIKHSAGQVGEAACRRQPNHPSDRYRVIAALFLALAPGLVGLPATGEGAANGRSIRLALPKGRHLIEPPAESSAAAGGVWSRTPGSFGGAASSGCCSAVTDGRSVLPRQDSRIQVVTWWAAPGAVSAECLVRHGRHT